MRTLKFMCICAMVVFVAAAFMATGRVFAQNGYPIPLENYVNDFAGLLTGETASAIRTHLQDIRESRGVEMTVVTIGSINDYPTDDNTIEQFATGLFNTWGIGDAQLNNGILILVAAQDRAMRIEVGSGYGSRMNDDMQVYAPYPANTVYDSRSCHLHFNRNAANGKDMPALHLPRSIHDRDPDEGAVF